MWVALHLFLYVCSFPIEWVDFYPVMLLMAKKFGIHSNMGLLYSPDMTQSNAISPHWDRGIVQHYKSTFTSAKAVPLHPDITMYLVSALPDPDKKVHEQDEHLLKIPFFALLLPYPQLLHRTFLDQQSPIHPTAMIPFADPTCCAYLLPFLDPITSKTSKHKKMAHLTECVYTGQQVAYQRDTLSNDVDPITATVFAIVMTVPLST